MTFQLHFWHLFVLLTLILVAWIWHPVENDRYGIGAAIKGLSGIVGIVMAWLLYFSGRFFFG